MVAIAITRLELTAAELRAASAKSRDAQPARRMLALALVLEGVDRKTAAQTCGMDRQTLRDWVHRYNAEGLAGLTNHRGAPRPRRLDPGQVSEFMAWLEAGPDPAVDGVVRWRRQDLQRRLAARLGVELHERTVGKYLAALGYRRLSVRPRPCATLCPDPGEGALLADAGLVLEPDLERLAARSLWDRRGYRLGEAFLKASCVAGSVFGCRGRTESRR